MMLITLMVSISQSGSWRINKTWMLDGEKEGTWGSEVIMNKVWWQQFCLNHCVRNSTPNLRNLEYSRLQKWDVTGNWLQAWLNLGLLTSDPISTQPSQCCLILWQAGPLLQAWAYGKSCDLECLLSLHFEWTVTLGQWLGQDKIPHTF